MLLFVLLIFVLINVSSGYDWCPQYHLIRGTNKYDPSGPIYYNNLWHVFEDSCGWCHYYSSDLLHWKQLSPTYFNGNQKTNTGSTTSINNNNQVVAFWGFVNQSGIIRSISNDNLLLNWTNTGIVIKPNKNITGHSNEFKDPLRPLTINGNTYIGISAGYGSNLGTLLWYKALNSNLTKFEFMGYLFNVSKTDGCIDPKTVMYNPNKSQPLKEISCADLFLMDDKFVLFASLGCTNEYWVGEIDINKNKFIPQKHSLLDFGNFYAGKTGTVSNGVNGEVRRILFGFTGWNEPTAPTQCGRSHVIPRHITLNNNNTLNFEPIDEIKSIRVGSNSNYKGSELQIILSCNMISNELPTFGNISVHLLESIDNLQYVDIGYSFENNGYFYVDQRKCCDDKNDIIQTVSFDTKKIINENGIYFNILLDRSVIESFFNRQKVITSMINPSNN
eukprot:83519_1